MDSNGATAKPSSSARIEQTKQQVDEVVGIMRVNVEKVLQRDEKLTELQDRAEALQEGGKRFEGQAQKLRRKYWWQNMKLMIIMGIIAVIVLIIIVASISSSS